MVSEYLDHQGIGNHAEGRSEGKAETARTRRLAAKRAARIERGIVSEREAKAWTRRVSLQGLIAEPKS